MRNKRKKEKREKEKKEWYNSVVKPYEHKLLLAGRVFNLIIY